MVIVRVRVCAVAIDEHFDDRRCSFVRCDVEERLPQCAETPLELVLVLKEDLDDLCPVFGDGQIQGCDGAADQVWVYTREIQKSFDQVRMAVLHRDDQRCSVCAAS